MSTNDTIPRRTGLQIAGRILYRLLFLAVMWTSGFLNGRAVEQRKSIATFQHYTALFETLSAEFRSLSSVVRQNQCIPFQPVGSIEVYGDHRLQATEIHGNIDSWSLVRSPHE